MERDWRDGAACRGIEASIFYPASDDEADPAKAICGACGVREECLEHALGSREANGVWGGATESERRRLVRRRRRRVRVAVSSGVR